MTDEVRVRMMRECLERAGRRAREQGRLDEAREIEAVLEADPEAEMDALLRGYPLTPRQTDCLKLIVSYRRLYGFSPTIQELADAMGICKVSCFGHVRALQKKGVVRRERYRSRGLVPAV